MDARWQGTSGAADEQFGGNRESRFPNPDTGRFRQIARAQGATHARLSPDGSQIVLSELSADDPTQSDIKLIDCATGSTRVLLGGHDDDYSPDWHRAGFRLYWRWRSRRRGGRPKVTDEIRGLIRRLAEENPDWGAPKVHGELLKLGFVVSERTVARYLRRIRRRGDPGKRWLAFLQNHREVGADELFPEPRESRHQRAYMVLPDPKIVNLFLPVYRFCTNGPLFRGSVRMMALWNQ